MQKQTNALARTDSKDLDSYGYTNIDRNPYLLDHPMRKPKVFLFERKYWIHLVPIWERIWYNLILAGIVIASLIYGFTDS